MVCCRRLLPLTPLLALSLACQPPAQHAMTEMQRTAIADSVKQLAEGFVAAFRNLDPSVFVDQLAINEQHVENGSLHPSRDSLLAAVRSFATSLSKLAFVWDDMQVSVLAPTAAVLTGTYRETAVDKNGAQTKLRGAWTGVYERRAGKWGIVQAHESYAIVK
jgi:uncharacterized protein (TIGR02246 family)